MINPSMMRAPIVFLKEGTEAGAGRELVLSNIKAAKQIVETIKTTLGPTGQDKLMQTPNNKIEITNDGATVLDLLNVIHPAAQTLVDISKSQDAEVGDGTTSVVILAGEFLELAKNFIEDGLQPQVIVQGYRRACELALEQLSRFEIRLDEKSEDERRALVVKCAETALNSKLLANHKKHFGEIVYESVKRLGSTLDKSMIGVKKVSGGSIEQSFLVDGVAFQKCFSYAGFEQAPKHFLNPKIALLHIELELKAEKDNAEIRIDNPSEYQKMIDAEWKIILDKLESIVKSGAQVVLSRLVIGDLATQYFADRQIFCAGRVEEGDMLRLSKATGAKIRNTVSDLSVEVLGTCGEFCEEQIGNERFNVFNKCPIQAASTIILRGGASQFIAEAERSLHDSIMVCSRTLQTARIIGGGGAVEMELSAHLRKYAQQIPGKQQLIINAYARALEVIPRTLASNAGLDSTDILTKLRMLHSKGEESTRWFGVDCLEVEPQGEGVIDTVKQFVWEPTLIKSNALMAATEGACAILMIDEVIKNPKSNPDPKSGPGGMPANPGAVQGRGHVRKAM